MLQKKWLKRFSILAVIATVSCGQQELAKLESSPVNVSPTFKSGEKQLQARQGRLVEFHIPSGTGEAAWNTEATTVTVTVGDTLRIINDDQIEHRLHTNGRPFNHGDTIAVQGSADYTIARTYDAATNGPLYDHNVGQSAQFWLRANANVNSTNATSEMLHEASLNIPIIDQGNAEYKFALDEGGYLTNMSVHVILDHTFIGDLVVTLTAPSGQTAILHNRTGNDADNIDKVFGVGGEENADLSNMNGSEINGDWTLKILDQAGGDVGVLKYFSLSGSRVL